MRSLGAKSFAGLFGATLVAMAGCAAVDADTEETAERESISDLEDALVGPVNARRSLVVTEQSILNKFSFQEVMTQLVATSGTATTALGLFQQWWDTARTSPGLGAGINCNTPGIQNMNGFPYACPRAEGNQATVNPFINAGSNPDAYVPIGLFNRFDLAAADGAHCGQYRVVFAKRSGITNPQARNFLNFEAVLLNPTPAAGLEGCRPVAEFWANLSADPNAGSRGDKLKQFYFTGLPGFMPVLHIDNMGARASNTGQVRTNQFMQPTWLLREFSIQRDCSAGPCLARFVPDTVKGNPGGSLFNPGSSHALASEFQTSIFPEQVASLAMSDINLLGMDIPDAMNSGQSNAQGPENHYLNQFGPGPSQLRSNIQGELAAIGSPLMPEHIVGRAMALSCAGCHQLSNNANLGGGMIWPPSLGFVHISEQTEPGPDGPRFRISPALVNVFIPHRRAIFETFLNDSCGDGVCNPWETKSVCSTDCP